jgi:hypothetical protein
MVGPFIFRCPATSLNVQHIFDDEAPETGDERAYVGVRCLACTGGEPRDRSSDFPTKRTSRWPQAVSCCASRPRHKFNISRVAPPGHDRLMKQRGKASSRRRRGTQGTMAAKRAADDRALALLPTIRKLMTAGFASDFALADELNRRGITGARGGRWHRITVRRLLTRLRQLTSAHGGTNNLALKRVADVRAEPYSPTIRRLRKAGFVSGNAIARELNARGITNGRGQQMAPQPPLPDCWSALTGSIVARAANVAAGAVFCPWNRISPR